jgi:DNA-binding transcriptional ArsR family regulator
VNRLANRDVACVCEFNSLGLSQPTISHHLKVLREAGLIEVAYKRGTFAYYRLVPEAVEGLAFALGGAPQPELVLATAEGTLAR